MVMGMIVSSQLDSQQETEKAKKANWECQRVFCNLETYPQ